MTHNSALTAVDTHCAGPHRGHTTATKLSVWEAVADRLALHRVSHAGSQAVASVPRHSAVNARSHSGLSVVVSRHLQNPRRLWQVLGVFKYSAVVTQHWKHVWRHALVGAVVDPCGKYCGAGVGPSVWLARCLLRDVCSLHMRPHTKQLRPKLLLRSGQYTLW